jgi:5'-deoxynucleotidase YfbR-like HD superfamily hydrolase
MTTKQIIAALKKKRVEMAKLRDELREIEAEITDEADRVSDACESLEYCIERLSETV